MRLWAGPFVGDLSGDTSLIRLAIAFVTSALSRAFSASAACADWIALEVPDLEVAILGDWGFSGSGGGARSGSELSHLVLFSFRRIEDMCTSCLDTEVERRILTWGPTRGRRTKRSADVSNFDPPL